MTPRTWVSIFLLLLACAYALANEFTNVGPLAPWIAGILLIWAALEWRELVLIARLTIVVAVALGGFCVATGTMSSDLWAAAMARSTFFTLFLASMDMLRTAAMSSPMVLRTGEVIVNQPPGRRYTMLTVGAFVFSTLLNLGSVNLLGTMTRRATDTTQDENARVVRLRRMTLAIIRGFTAFTMWAPTALTVLVVLSTIPGLTWSGYAPMGSVVLVSYLTLGYVMDRLSHKKTNVTTTQIEPVRQVLLAFAPMVMLTVSILAFALALSQLTGMRLIPALLSCIPVFGVGWLWVQSRRAGRLALALTGRKVLRQLLPSMVTLRSEIGILSSASFISVVLPSKINTDWLGQTILQLGLTEGWLLALMMVCTAIGAPIGLNPIISVPVSLGILGALPGFDFHPLHLAFSGTIAWSLATGASPLGASIRIAGRTVGYPAARVGLEWNRAFILMVMGISCAIVILLN